MSLQPASAVPGQRYREHTVLRSPARFRCTPISEDGTVSDDATDLSVLWTDAPEHCGSAIFDVRRCSSNRIAIAVSGEVDAINGRSLGRYVEHHTRRSTQLVLDLRSVDFFGSHGFTALYFISIYCARRDVDWTIVASHPVQRLLAVCDPQGELPLSEDLSTALLRLDRLAERRDVVWTSHAGWQSR